MSTQQQAYIEGFTKRASEYGLNQYEAVELLKRSFEMPSMKDVYNSGKEGIMPSMKDVYNSGKEGIQSIGNRLASLADNLESDVYNKAVNGITSIGVPHHIADYGMKTLQPNDFLEGTKNVFTNKYNSDVFAKDHPYLQQAADFLKSKNIDPTMAAAGVAGAGLLGGGYMLGKHLNKKKHVPQQYMMDEE